MKKTCEQDQEFDELLQAYLEDADIQKMRSYKAHGRYTVLDHCLSVAKMAYRIDRCLGSKSDLKTLLSGAILHDFYLYDWHDARIDVDLFNLHIFTHPEAACRNAVAYFNVDEDVQKVIRSHMWPLTFRSFPSSREAMIVCLADKLCALKETFQR